MSSPRCPHLTKIVNTFVARSKTSAFHETSLVGILTVICLNVVENWSNCPLFLLSVDKNVKENQSKAIFLNDLPKFIIFTQRSHALEEPFLHYSMLDTFLSMLMKTKLFRQVLSC